MIDKDKLLEWLKEWRDGDDLKDFRTAVGIVVKEIESGTFDIKEDTDHADRG